jgi:hypothetical protein
LKLNELSVSGKLDLNGPVAPRFAESGKTITYKTILLAPRRHVGLEFDDFENGYQIKERSAQKRAANPARRENCRVNTSAGYSNTEGEARLFNIARVGVVPKQPAGARTFEDDDFIEFFSFRFVNGHHVDPRPYTGRG